MPTEQIAPLDGELHVPGRTPFPTESDPIPTYRIDLALAPEDRYAELARDFSSQLRSIAPVFQELLDWFVPLRAIRPAVWFLARFLLRRLHDEEQDREVKALAKASGVEGHLLVALNVLLDALLGCTSGAAMVGGDDCDGGGGEGGEELRMVHFRTLDWSMDRLRELLVVLEFVDSASARPDEVIARSVTYAGFVGVLTGVRQDLSISLNFRPGHQSASPTLLRWHQLLVLLGFRPSISSVLRDVIFRPRPATQSAASMAAELTTLRTTPCYLVLCDGSSASVLEKDFASGIVRSDSAFIVQTNHDVGLDGRGLSTAKGTTPSAIMTAEDGDPRKEGGTEDATKTGNGGDDVGAGGEDDEMWWVVESGERMGCMHEFWRAGTLGTAGKWAGLRELEERMRTGPISRGWTHFRCVMDPRRCAFAMLERGPPPDEVVVAVD